MYFVIPFDSLVFSWNLFSMIILQIHEKRFNSFGPSEESGSFVMDKYIGQKTSFNCFALYPGNTENGYVKSITLEDRKGNRFKSIVDSMAFYHILSLYNVPFESVSRLNNW